MLKDRIVHTLRFFDLQSYPLTLLELTQFLMQDMDVMKESMNERYETSVGGSQSVSVSAGDILECIETECGQSVEQCHGFYFLQGRKELAFERMYGYVYGIEREKSIKKYVPFVQYIPFIRGVAVGGSQAMGLQKSTSDIDLLVFTEKNRLWVARTFITLYFQLLGKRRHGLMVANRFCLNHYREGFSSISYGRDAYNAMEYVRLRPVVNRSLVCEFIGNNMDWISVFFPQSYVGKFETEKQSSVQSFFELFFQNSFGDWLELQLKNWQLTRIQKGEFVVAASEEISFHSVKRKLDFLARFFKHQE